MKYTIIGLVMLLAVIILIKTSAHVAWQLVNGEWPLLYNRVVCGYWGTDIGSGDCILEIKFIDGTKIQLSEVHDGTSISLYNENNKCIKQQMGDMFMAPLK